MPMDLYDGFIKQTWENLEESRPIKFPYSEGKCWPEQMCSEMIMLRDAACELGGGNKESVNYVCITTTPEMVKENAVYLYGQDLRELSGDCAFGRIVLLEVEDMAEEEQQIYKFVRDMEYVKYHIFPKGYMVRTSAKSLREQARVGKTAIRQGISFEMLGNMYIRRYLKCPAVRHVQIIFLTNKMELSSLVEIGKKADAVTEALNHILKGMPMNCGECSVREICDEVDGMRKLHGRKK